VGLIFICAPVLAKNFIRHLKDDGTTYPADIAEVRGQEHVKRALEIAAPPENTMC
jgi:predicted ATPase with chaperone activity